MRLPNGTEVIVCAGTQLRGKTGTVVRSWPSFMHDVGCKAKCMPKRAQPGVNDENRCNGRWSWAYRVVLDNSNGKESTLRHWRISRYTDPATNSGGFDPGDILA